MLFPSIVKDKYETFNYLKNDVLKIIIFTKTSYHVNNINTNFHLQNNKKSITFVIDQGSAICKICVKQRYKINFTHYDTLRDMFGFNVIFIDQTITEFFNKCDLFISINIYVQLALALGSIFQGKSTNISFNFPSNIAF